MNRLLVVIVLVCVVAVSGCKQQSTEVFSPDNSICIGFSKNHEGKLSYEVKVKDSLFVSSSLMGFVEKKGVSLSDALEIVDVDHSSSDETWTQPWGENKTIRNRYNEMAVHLSDGKDVSLVIRFRAFDDGVGFRYEYDVRNVDSLLITEELTEFNIAKDGISWSIPASFETYELLYRTLPISKVDNANTPMTFKSGYIYASIHEAALTDFPEMTLKRIDGCRFKSDLAPWPDGIKAKIAGGKFTTPWRTIQIGSRAVDLINSSLILNLNEPCKLETTDWIRPMKYIGIWWGMHLGVETWYEGKRHGATTANAKRYIDFAADNNIDAVVYEGWNKGWENWGGSQEFDYTAPYDDFDINEIADYARKRGVKLIGHHETGGNILNYERQLDDAYKWYSDMGINSVKTGYAGGLPDGHNHHGQFNVRHYRKVVETAAKYHTTLDVHEPIKDTGIRRTYPNMMTREGARGMEWNAWSDGNPPSHHVMLPFTRLLSGPMDYTPGIFDITYERIKDSPDRKQWNMKDSKDCRVNTTLAKQIANWVILYSPLQMASDMIENYEGHPAFQFFRDFDPDCDWSEALEGEPGEYVVIVRKANDKYFLGAATNEDTREVEISLDFLEPGRTYDAVIYADGDDADWETNPTSYKITNRQVTSEDKLQIKMARGGGQAIYFRLAE
ncbi:glycoside hydrolase family 97 protein [Bacteroides caecigallinarum]|uniref:glycoside hydrolase family 97 protein n=1 Tax=Bacteroides caecigallinarum TaxID=1411144 RepID=UPI00195A376F|nr:glycoside hydrolase family 97 protein [Bacteroides caecigallinarum]MBM6865955.1 glycoside hydrolase family 97 protein [Bacteroides caecigallinarum]